MSDQETRQPSKDASERKSAPTTDHRGKDRNRSKHRHAAPASRTLEQSVNMDELRELVELIAEYGFTDFELENKDVRVRLRRELAPQVGGSTAGGQSQDSLGEQRAGEAAQAGSSAAPNVSASSSSTSSTTAPAPTPVAEDEDLIPIPSPIVGTFYRSPSPTAEAFVNLGSQVMPDTIVCIIEAMKLMNEIQAEATGIIVKIYVENGQPVEYGQPLFGIKK